MRFREAVIDVRAKRLKRNGPLVILLASCDFGAVETAADHHFDALDACAHGAADRLLHRTSEGHTLLELSRDTFRHELRVAVGLSHFRDIDADRFAARKLSQILFDRLHFRARFADDDAGTRGVDGCLLYTSRCV